MRKSFKSIEEDRLVHCHLNQLLIEERRSFGVDVNRGLHWSLVSSGKLLIEEIVKSLHFYVLVHFQLNVHFLNMVEKHILGIEHSVLQNKLLLIIEEIFKLCTFMNVHISVECTLSKHG